MFEEIRSSERSSLIGFAQSITKVAIKIRSAMNQPKTDFGAKGGRAATVGGVIRVWHGTRAASHQHTRDKV